MLVGSDLPDLSPEPLRAAVDVLDAEPHVLVLGPAADGGYYLVGATQLPDIFTGIDWGGPDVLAQTRSRRGPGPVWRAAIVAMQSDVDRPSDLALVRARRTTAWVEQARPRRASASVARLASATLAAVASSSRPWAARSP